MFLFFVCVYLLKKCLLRLILLAELMRPLKEPPVYVYLYNAYDVQLMHPGRNSLYL